MYENKKAEEYPEMTNEEYYEEINKCICGVEDRHLLQYLHRFIIGRVEYYNLQNK